MGLLSCVLPYSLSFTQQIPMSSGATTQRGEEGAGEVLGDVMAIAVAWDRSSKVLFRTSCRSSEMPKLKLALGCLLAITVFSPSETRAQQLTTYCSQTQSDDCIQVDSYGFWWVQDQDDFRLPARKTSKKLPIRVIGKTKIVRLDNTYYCTHSSMQVSRSYLKCSADGWVFKSN